MREPARVPSASLAAAEHAAPPGAPERGVLRPVESALVAIAVTTTVFLGTPVTSANAGFDSDGLYYGAMAGEARIPAQLGHVPPWCRRVLTPFLASLLPFETLQSFRIIAFASDVAALVLLAGILGRLGFARRFQLAGMALYATSFWTLRFSFYSPAYIDSQTQVFLLGITALTLAGRYGTAAVVAGLGTLQKESVGPFAAFVVAHAIRHRARLGSRLGRTIAMAIGIPAFALAVEAWVFRDSAYGSGRVVIDQAARLATLHFWPVLAAALFSGTGALLAVAAVRPRECGRWCRERWEWVVYLSLCAFALLGGSDKARLFAYGLPALVILALVAMDAIAREAPRGWTIAWGAVAFAAHLVISGGLCPLTRFDSYLAEMVPEHSTRSFLPYLVRNASLAAVVLCSGLALVLQSSRSRAGSRPAVGR